MTQETAHMPLDERGLEAAYDVGRDYVMEMDDRTKQMLRVSIRAYLQTLSPPTSELEALRKRVAELERAKIAAFNRGYVTACCNISNLHNDEVIAYDVLANLGVAKHEISDMDLSEYDLRALKEIEKARSESPYSARRVREGGKVE